MTSVSHEAAEVVRLIERGILKDRDEAAELIGVTDAQRKVLIRFLGADHTEIVMQYRRAILREFERLTER